MKNPTLVLVYLLGSFGVLTADLHSQEGPSAKPPVTPVRPVTDDYYGTKIVDNYRYMENLTDPEVQEWLKNQDVYTRATLASIPGREKLLARMRELDTSAPVWPTRDPKTSGEEYGATFTKTPPCASPLPLASD